MIGICGNAFIGFNQIDLLLDALYDNTKEIGWHMGYADVPATVDLQTFRQIPWEEDLPFFLMDFTDPDNKKNLAVCPRVLLKKVIEDLQKNQLTAKVGPEFEWFNFRETPESIKAKNYINPEPLTPGILVLRLSMCFLFFVFKTDINLLRYVWIFTSASGAKLGILSNLDELWQSFSCSF